ncbi:MAG: hypothetical protein Q8M44_05420, partial [bacterium]|nr:hypothetical protein [bacterium]
MEIRQRQIISILFFMIGFSSLSFADSSNIKKDFISEVLPDIEKAKDDIGGIAVKIPASLVLAQAIHE